MYDVTLFTVFFLDVVPKQVLGQFGLVELETGIASLISNVLARMGGWGVWLDNDHNGILNSNWNLADWK